VSRWGWLAAGVLGGLLAWLLMGAGGWWLTFPLGLAAGALQVRRLHALGAGLLVGLLGWGLPLAAIALGGAPLGRTAVVVSGILGAAAGGVPAIAVTMLTGIVLATAGAWLGLALRRLAIQPA